jgi:hypothetical protein
MSEEEERADVLEAHQELVGHVERSAGAIRLLSAVTVVVALILTGSYAYQLLLPYFGTTSVTVNLADPANQAAEAVVLVLALLWLYVGARDFAFSSRMRKQIRKARTDEAMIERKITD